MALGVSVEEDILFLTPVLLASAVSILGGPLGWVISWPRPLAHMVFAIDLAAVIVVLGVALVAEVVVTWAWFWTWTWAWAAARGVLDVRDGKRWAVVAVTGAAGVRVEPRHVAVGTAPTADGEGHVSGEVALDLLEISVAAAIRGHRVGLAVL